MAYTYPWREGWRSFAVQTWAKTAVYSVKHPSLTTRRHIGCHQGTRRSLRPDRAVRSRYTASLLLLHAATHIIVGRIYNNKYIKYITCTLHITSHVLRHDSLSQKVTERRFQGKKTPGRPRAMLLNVMMQEDGQINYIRKAERKSTWQRNLASMRKNLPLGRKHRTGHHISPVKMRSGLPRPLTPRLSLWIRLCQALKHHITAMSFNVIYGYNFPYTKEAVATPQPRRCLKWLKVCSIFYTHFRATYARVFSCVDCVSGLVAARDRLGTRTSRTNDQTANCALSSHAACKWHVHRHHHHYQIIIIIVIIIFFSLFIMIQFWGLRVTANEESECGPRTKCYKLQHGHQRPPDICV